MPQPTTALPAPLGKVSPEALAFHCMQRALAQSQAQLRELRPLYEARRLRLAQQLIGAGL